MITDGFPVPGAARSPGGLGRSRCRSSLRFGALDREAITVTEDQLIATPFVFEFSDELLAELSP